MATAVHAQQQQLCAVISDPQSALTYNPAAPAKKRPRDADGPLLLPPQPPQTDARQMHSNTTSTSGRSSAFLSLLDQQNAEIDALVRFQMDKVRSGVEEARKRRCGAILAALELQASRRMEEKEAELQALRRRNAELQERVRQVAAEGQIWFHVARSSEALVAGLQARLEEALASGAAGKEGFGECGGGDDATSCCFEGEAPAAKTAATTTTTALCKACGQREASVLVFPCRHLSLCESCDGTVVACPLCLSETKQTFKVLLA